MKISVSAYPAYPALLQRCGDTRNCLNSNSSPGNTVVLSVSAFSSHFKLLACWRCPQQPQ